MANLNVSVPPWLDVHPSDFVRAAQAGAALGAQISEAQARINAAAQARAQAAWEFQQQMRERAQQRQAEERRASAQLEAATRYHLATLEEARQRARETSSHNAALEQAAQDRVDLERQRVSQAGTRPQAGQNRIINGDLVRVNPDGTVTTLMKGTPKPAPMSPADKAMLGVKVKRLAALEDWLAKNPPVKGGFFGGGTEGIVAQQQKAADELRQEIAQLGGGTSTPDSGAPMNGPETVFPKRILPPLSQSGVTPPVPSSASMATGGWPQAGSAIGDLLGGGPLMPSSPDAATPSQAPKAKREPPQAAVDYLMKNPSTAHQFDAKYGDGASDEYLKDNSDSDVQDAPLTQEEIDASDHQ
jgi:multidrug efflux pump subunit AcrA (membrane-fusion protein)